jgi:DNA-binding response OmpR family regulator
MKILLIEDERQLGESITQFLVQENYICEWAQGYLEADEKIAMYSYNCALVDITLPDGNGLQLVRTLKQTQPHLGIIIISAKNSLDDKVEGLDIGADDYLTKPFHLSELNSRIKSLQRRMNFGGSAEVFIGPLRILPTQHEAWCKEELLPLTKKEFALLLYFVSNKNRVLSKEAIAEHLWGEETDSMDSFDFVYSHIKNLRKKIATSGGGDLINSVYGIGYKLAEI